MASRFTSSIRRTRCSAKLDTDVSDRFTVLAQERWDVHLSATITGVRRSDTGGATVVLDDGTKVTGDLLLVAAGRQPNTDDMGLELAGVKVRDDGRVQVDEYGRTTADGIWSIGDASSPFELKHVANAEARTVAHNLAHPEDLRPFRHEWVPAAVFTDPEIATVGARLQDLAGKRPYVQSTQPYHDTAYGWALQDTIGFCRLYADPDDRHAPRRPHPRLSGLPADPAAGPGHVVRAERRQHGPAASTGFTRRSARWWRTPCSSSRSAGPATPSCSQNLTDSKFMVRVNHPGGTELRDSPRRGRVRHGGSR